MISTTLHPWTTKLLWFLTPSLFGALAWWYVVGRAIDGRLPLTVDQLGGNIGLFILAFGGFGFWLGALFITTYLAGWRSVRFVLSIVLALPLLMYFPFTMLTGLATIVVMAGLWWGMEQLASDIHNRLTVQPWRTLSITVPVSIACILVAVAVLTYQQVRGNTKTTDELTDRLVNQTVTITEKFLPLVYPHYTTGMTVDELIGGQIPTADDILRDVNFDALPTKAAQEAALRETLVSLGFDPEQFSLDSATSTAALKQTLDRQLTQFRTEAIAQTRATVGEKLNVVLNGDDTVHQALITIITERFNPWLQRYAKVVPIILAVSIFLILRIFTFLFTWIAMAFGWVMYRLLLSLRIVHIITHTVPAQSLEWGP